MSLDGFGVATQQPYNWEVQRPKDYRFHKGGFAIILLAGCDIQARFIATSCDHIGSTNDIIAWQDTKLHELLEVDKLLCDKYFFIGDEAFTNTFQFLSPWSGRGLDPYKGSFNFPIWNKYAPYPPKLRIIFGTNSTNGTRITRCATSYQRTLRHSKLAFKARQTISYKTYTYPTRYKYALYPPNLRATLQSRTNLRDEWRQNHWICYV